MVLKGGKAPLGVKERELHARLIAEGRPMSGRSGSYVYYMRKGRQRWHRYIIPRDPRTPPCAAALASGFRRRFKDLERESGTDG